MQLFKSKILTAIKNVRSVQCIGQVSTICSTSKSLIRASLVATVYSAAQIALQCLYGSRLLDLDKLVCHQNSGFLILSQPSEAPHTTRHDTSSRQRQCGVHSARMRDRPRDQQQQPRAADARLMIPEAVSQLTVNIGLLLMTIHPNACHSTPGHIIVLKLQRE